MATAKKLKANRPQVYDFQNYRSYLEAQLGWLKEQGIFANKKAFCQAAKVSQGYLADILSGRRSLASGAYEKFVKVLDITEPEKNILKYLIALSDSNSQLEKAEAFESICRNGLYKSRNLEAIKACRYIKKWHYVAIREMAALPNVKYDLKEIQRKLQYKLPLDDIRDAVFFLLREGYVVEENGYLKEGSDQLLRCDGDIYKLSLAEMHKEFLGLALKSIYEVGSENRHLSNYTLSLPEDEFHQVKDVIDEALNKIHKISQDVNAKRTADSVYHISFLSFPIVTGKDGGKDD